MRMCLLQVGQQLQVSKLWASQPVTHCMCLSLARVGVKSVILFFSQYLENNGANKHAKLCLCVCVNIFACDMY